MSYIQKIIQSLALLWLSIGILTCGCGMTRREARLELERMSIQYNQEAFIEGVKNHDPLVVELFLMAGMDTDTEDTDGQPALILAVESGYSIIVEELLVHGADVNTRDKTDHYAAIDLAEESGYAEIEQRLKEAGAK